MAMSEPSGRTISFPVFSSLGALRGRGVALGVAVIIVVAVLALAWSEHWARSNSTPPLSAVTGVVVAQVTGGLLPTPQGRIVPVSSTPLVVSGTTATSTHLDRRLATGPNGRFTLKLPAWRVHHHSSLFLRPGAGLWV